MEESPKINKFPIIFAHNTCKHIKEIMTSENKKFPLTVSSFPAVTGSCTSVGCISAGACSEGADLGTSSPAL